MSSSMHAFSEIRKVAVISDTHGLLREKLLLELQGSDLILHAGDVGKLSLLTKLSEIAPVISIRGNIDPPTGSLPATEIIEINHRLVYLLHNLADLDLDPTRAGFQLVVSGHSHKPAFAEKKGVLYLNPGSVGPRRFNLPISFARLNVTREKWEADFIEIQPD